MRLIGPRKYTLEELAKHDGSNPELPLLLAFHGKVYDVVRQHTLNGLTSQYKLVACHVFVCIQHTSVLKYITIIATVVREKALWSRRKLQ